MDISVLDLLIRADKFNPDGIALEDENQSMTWSEILTAVRAVATGLIKRRIVKNGKSPIPVLIDKSVMEIVAFWGVAYTGNFYVPIDEKMPYERMALILHSIEAKVIICDEKNSEKIRAVNKEITVLDIRELLNAEILMDEIEECRKNIIDMDPLYALFTSGSTGNPKGVVCCHRSVLTYSEWVVETFGFSSETKCGNQTPLYFSMSVLDLYSVLRCRGTLTVIPSRYFSQPKKLIAFLNEHKINTVYWVPSALCMISRFKALDKYSINSLRMILFAGEVMPTKQLNYWVSKMPDVVYANLFGPTEITDIGIYYVLDRSFNDDEPIPIGKKCLNVAVEILDEQFRPVEMGGGG